MIGGVCSQGRAAKRHSPLGFELLPILGRNAAVVYLSVLQDYTGHCSPSGQIPHSIDSLRPLATADPVLLTRVWSPLAKARTRFREAIDAPGIEAALRQGVVNGDVGRNASRLLERIDFIRAVSPNPVTRPGQARAVGVPTTASRNVSSVANVRFGAISVSRSYEGFWPRAA